MLYDTHIFNAKEFDIKTICVGNLSAGGTGKTPHVDYLISLLKNEMLVATLSRGYGRKSSGYILATENSDWQEIGDEPCQYKQKHPQVNVAVDANHKNGITKLQNDIKDLQIILMDDAFQHRAVKAGLNVVLTDYKNLYLNDSMLPSGTLREFKSGIQRADIIVVSKCPQTLQDNERNKIIERIYPDKNRTCFFLRWFMRLKLNQSLVQKS